MVHPALRSLSRLISFLLASSTSLAILLAPRLIATQSNRVPHGFLALAMLGGCCAWLHAFGFNPRFRFLKLFQSPIIAWMLITLGIAGILHRNGMLLPAPSPDQSPPTHTE